MADARLWLDTADRFARLRRIESLGLKENYREIAMLFYTDFQPVMMPKSFNGLMFTYAAPRISRVLATTGESEHRIAKRVVDTALLAQTVMQHGFASSSGAKAVRRVNEMHSRYEINEDDFIAVGCESIVDTLTLADRFGWRPVTEKEREAIRIYFNSQARAFGSRKPLPASLPLVEHFYSGYLDTELRYESQNRRLAKILLNWFCGLAPALVRPLLPAMMLSNLDPRIVKACGMKMPSKLTVRVAHRIMKQLGRRDPLPDNAPNGLAGLVRSVYPDGWDLDTLGTHLGRDGG
jgi:hypothetical protein